LQNIILTLIPPSNPADIQTFVAMIRAAPASQQQTALVLPNGRLIITSQYFPVIPVSLIDSERDNPPKFISTIFPQEDWGSATSVRIQDTLYAVTTRMIPSVHCPKSTMPKVIYLEAVNEEKQALSRGSAAYSTNKGAAAMQRGSAGKENQLRGASSRIQLPAYKEEGGGDVSEVSSEHEPFNEFSEEMRGLHLRKKANDGSQTHDTLVPVLRLNRFLFFVSTLLAFISME
jgi:hypothetical protein